MSETEVIEVHNAYAIYGTNPDGTEAETAIQQFSRPQDWGDSRWHYERFRFEWTYSGHRGKHYVNHAHCWTDLQLEPHEYLQLFASSIVMILMPGKKPELCGRDFLEEEDFWNEDWGPMPPIYHAPDEDYDYDE